MLRLIVYIIDAITLSAVFDIYLEIHIYNEKMCEVIVELPASFRGITNGIVCHDHPHNSLEHRNWYL